VAGVNYEVNIQLNAKTLDKQLSDLEKRVNNLKKNLAAPLRGDESAARRAVATEQKRARLAERRQATQIVTFNLGRKVNELEARGVDVSKIREKLNKAALENDKGRLTLARAQNSVARTLINQEQAKLRISTKAGRMQAENIDALYKARVKRYTLDQQIRRLEEAGVNTTKLRAQLGEATTAQARRQFGSFKQITGELSLAIRKERDKLALQIRQTRELERQRKLGMGTGATSPIGGTPQMVGSPAYKTRQLNLNANWTKFLGDLNDTAQIINATRANNARVNQFKKAQINRNWGLFLDQLNETSRVIQQSAKAGQRKKRNERLQGVALGAGFPLLFGGGPGAVLGGAAGGLVGGPAGFAAQIALSALGQQLDKFVGSTSEASKAFTSTSKAFEFVREKSLFSSQQIEARAIELEKQGKAEELAKLLTEELTTVIGTDGVKSLKLLGDETSEVTRLWAQLTLQLQALIAGPLSNFLKLVSQFVGGITLRSQFSALEQSVTPAQAKRLQEILTEKRGTRTISAPQQRAALSDPRLQIAPITKDLGKQITLPGTITNEVLRQTLEQAAKEGIKAPATPLIPVTPLDTLGITPPKTKKGRRSRLPDLVAEGAKLQELLGLEQKRSELMLNQDKMGLARLDYQRELLGFTQEETKIRESDVPNEEKLQALKNVDYERQIAGIELERELAQIQKDRNQENMDALQKHIEAQYELNFAVQAQLQLAQSVAETMGTGMASAFDLLITGAENWSNSLRNIAATVLQDIARQLIQIYIIEQAVGFMKNLLTPFDASTPLGAGGGKVGKYGTFGPNYGIPQRAIGGPVSAGQPYMVGERGPEMFVPGAQGNIVPTSGMGGANIVVNVDATGSSVEGNANEQKQLGEAIGVAIRQELIKQKRPGGLLA